MDTRTDHAFCMLCEAICGLVVEHDGQRVLRVRGDPEHPLSRGHICPKGVALADVQNDPDRLRRPLRRRGEGWIGPSGALRLLLRLGPQSVSLGRLRREPHGVDLGPLEPRLPGLLGKGRCICLIPEPMRRDLPRLAHKLETAASTSSSRLLLIGRRTLRSNNSWMHNCERLVSGRNRCVLLMHPDDAQQRSLAAGQRVAVKSEVGRIEVPLAISDEMMPGVVSLPHGWGHDRPGAQLRVAAAHAGVSMNDAVDDASIDALSGTSVLNGVPVTVEALAG